MRTGHSDRELSYRLFVKVLGDCYGPVLPNYADREPAEFQSPGLTPSDGHLFGQGTWEDL
jgi:hypothetical protein